MIIEKIKFRVLELILYLLIVSCQAQDKRSDINYRLIGNCEGCEAVLEYTSPVNSIDTLPGFQEYDGTQIEISGIVFHSDGVTPAPDVILYFYHTNPEGIYESKPDSKGWEKRHGHIRGWVQTDQKGKYKFYTFMPGVYPSRSEPAHIHVTILEPDGKYYWVDSFHFIGDPLLTEKELNPKNPRGGNNGVIELKKTDSGLLQGKRNFILGKNIPGY